MLQPEPSDMARWKKLAGLPKEVCISGKKYGTLIHDHRLSVSLNFKCIEARFKSGYHSRESTEVSRCLERIHWGVGFLDQENPWQSWLVGQLELRNFHLNERTCDLKCIEARALEAKILKEDPE
ncbi:hypothetical protein BsWGS_25746 [Bradybaena similaris]